MGVFLDGCEEDLEEEEDLFDTLKSNFRVTPQLRDMLKSVLPSSVDIHAETELKYDDIRTLIRNDALDIQEPGRYSVLLCLAEAEHLRGCLHLLHRRREDGSSNHQDLIEGMNTSFGLYFNDTSSRKGTTTLIDGSARFKKAPLQQHITIGQCYRFVNSEVYYTEQNLNVLLRAVQLNSCSERRVFFNDVKSRRRRSTRPVAATPVERVFTTSDQFHLLEFRATVSRVRSALLARGYKLPDAFRMFDSDRNGSLSLSEFYGGLQWLGLKMSVKEIRTIFTLVNKKSGSSGAITFAAFKKAFRDPLVEEDEDPLLGGESAGTSTTPVFGFEDEIDWVVTPKEIEDDDEVSKVDEIPIDNATLKYVYFTSIKHTSFESIWTTPRGSDSARVWAPTLGSSFLSRMARARQIICLGHFANPGVKQLSKSDVKYSVLEVKNSGTFGAFSSAKRNLITVVNRFLPHPVRIVFERT